ncbi:hypothetical protein [Ignicoccus hospitalis]|nr:hypothetical protein [Ignicoccus hospitalis]HIH89968.1 hypothetical protein [Desulfurococcaceae archaeon]
MIASGRVILRRRDGVVVEANGKKFLMGYGAYLVWQSFLEGSTPEEVIAQAVALSGMRREEVESLILPLIDEMLSKGLLRH